MFGLFRKRANPVEMVVDIFELLGEDGRKAVNFPEPEFDLRLDLIKIARHSKSKYSRKKSMKKAKEIIEKIKGGVTEDRAKNMLCSLIIADLLKS